jgi:hypothetical protein
MSIVMTRAYSKEYCEDSKNIWVANSIYYCLNPCFWGKTTSFLIVHQSGWGGDQAHSQRVCYHYGNCGGRYEISKLVDFLNCSSHHSKVSEMKETRSLAYKCFMIGQFYRVMPNICLIGSYRNIKLKIIIHWWILESRVLLWERTVI